MELTAVDSASAKRKRSPSVSAPAGPPPKAAKSAHQLSINYLARQSQEDLPLINKEESLPSLLQLLSQYSNVLDRHESLASNLGARPLGPILIKRFERCFESPPKVVASHHKGAASSAEESPHSITWLEVIEFARSHPSQFTLSTFSEGKRVCQFYYPQKQLRVQVSEEDFLFINSGRCQELIPPLPIWEDEEKEVATCDVLEAKLKELTNAADMVAARTRQLSHRLKGRRAAILDRRAEGGSGTPAKASAQQTTTLPPSSGSAFTAVNTANGGEGVDPPIGSSSSVRTELLRHFESLPHNQNQGRAQPRHHSVTGPNTNQQSTEQDTGRAASTASSLSPVPANAFANDFMSYYTTDNPSSSRQPSNANHRPSSSTGNAGYAAGHTPLKHNFSRPLPPALESSQPFRPLCQAHMDGLPKGHRVLPPCDRCRRLRMDCVKNLTSCAGCTKKHARCHWRDVSREELGELDHLMEATYNGSAVSPGNMLTETHTNGYSQAGSDAGDLHHDESDDDDSNPLEDLEALEEKEEREEEEAAAERVREDEEGLRQARELALQARGDSLTTQPLEQTTGDPDVPLSSPSNASVPLMPASETTPNPQITTLEPKVDAADDVPAQTHTSTLLRPSYGEHQQKLPEQADHIPRPLSDSLPLGASQNHGGFRAVNSMSAG
jgi:hypothetical protein